jgi:thiopurine S-methyltransferase
MEPDFWHQRWQQNQIGFHEDDVNPALTRNIDALGLQPGDRVFVPLCGKTLDIGWLLDQGYRVAGAELSEIAVQQLFAELGVEPEIAATGKLSHYHATGIDIFVGDIFDLTADLLGEVHGIYDRAAMVALPPPMRKTYATHLYTITAGAAQLLIAFEYDQAQMKGPPFCVPNAEIEAHYADLYQMTLLTSAPLKGGLKGKTPATTNIWQLARHATG